MAQLILQLIPTALGSHWSLFLKKKKTCSFVFLFIFGCTGSSSPCAGFLQLRWAGAALCGGAQASRCGGFSLQNTGSRCGLQLLQHTASVVAVHRLSCSVALWNLAGTGIKPMSPALAGGLSSTVPPSKSHWSLLMSGMKVKVTRVKRLLPMQEIIMACTKNSENWGFREIKEDKGTSVPTICLPTTSSEVSWHSPASGDNCWYLAGCLGPESSDSLFGHNPGQIWGSGWGSNMTLPGASPPIWLLLIDLNSKGMECPSLYTHTPPHDVMHSQETLKVLKVISLDLPPFTLFSQHCKCTT